MKDIYSLVVRRDEQGEPYCKIEKGELKNDEFSRVKTFDNLELAEKQKDYIVMDFLNKGRWYDSYCYGEKAISIPKPVVQNENTPPIVQHKNTQTVEQKENPSQSMPGNDNSKNKVQQTEPSPPKPVENVPPIAHTKNAEISPQSENQKPNAHNQIKEILNKQSKEELEKLAEILAISEHISATEREKVLTNNEMQEKAKTVKNELPAPPKNILLRSVRSRQERKLAKSNKTIGAKKSLIKKQENKIKKVNKKIELNKRIQKHKSANKFLAGFGSDNGLKDFITTKNENAIARLEKNIAGHEKTLSKYNARISELQNDIKTQENAIATAKEKINTIDKMQDMPNAAIMLYLADKLGKADQMLENENEFNLVYTINENVELKINSLENSGVVIVNEQLELRDEFNNGEKYVPETKIADEVKKENITFSKIQIDKDDFPKIQQALDDLEEQGFKVKAVQSKENQNKIDVVFDKNIEDKVADIVSQTVTQSTSSQAAVSM